MMNPRFKVTPLGALLDQSPQNGYSPVCPDTPTGKWVLSLAALDGYGFNPRGLKPAPMDDPLVDKFLLKPGDFLISRSNTADKVGRVAVFRGEIEQCSYPDLMMRFRPNPNLVDLDYLELYLKSEAVVSHIQKHATGTSGSMKKINQATVEGIPVALPSVREQRNIAAIVRDWYAAIETTERLIAAKEAYIGAMTARIYRRSPGWSRYRLGDFLQETKVLHGHGDYVIGSVGKNGIKPRDEVYSKNLTSNHERNLLVKPGWLCFGLASDCMAFGVNSTNQTYSVSPAYRTFQINGADPRFFEGYLRVFNGRLSKRFLITSARQGKAIDFEGLFNTECYFPSREEQQQIASAVLLMREALDHLRQLREALKRQKRGLMQKLLTGKWRIQMEEGVPV